MSGLVLRPGPYAAPAARLRERIELLAALLFPAFLAASGTLSWLLAPAAALAVACLTPNRRHAVIPALIGALAALPLLPPEALFPPAAGAAGAGASEAGASAAGAPGAGLWVLTFCGLAAGLASSLAPSLISHPLLAAALAGRLAASLLTPQAAPAALAAVPAIAGPAALVLAVVLTRTGPGSSTLYLIAPWPFWLAGWLSAGWPGPLATGALWWPLALSAFRRRPSPGPAPSILATLAALALLSAASWLPAPSPLLWPSGLALMIAAGIWRSLTLARASAALTGPLAEPPAGDLKAFRLCARPAGVKALARHLGAPSCRLAAAMDGGPWACPQACLAYGDCRRVCPAGAVGESDGGSPPAIDARRCVGCGACAAACPKGLMILVPEGARGLVACRGRAFMREMDRLCPAGCLGCGRCRKACPASAVSRRGDQAPPAVDRIACAAGREAGCGEACRAACPRDLPSGLPHAPPGPADVESRPEKC